MTGVTEVVSFEENNVVLQTGLGTLVVQGSDLKLKTLSPEGGQVEVDGSISAVGATPPPATSTEEYEGYFSQDNYTHLEVFTSPTPEPDSAAMEP